MDNSPYQVRIESLAVGGAGVGAVVSGPTGSSGKRAFVQFSLPGELVTLAEVVDKKSFVEGTLGVLNEASPDRVTPDCPHFGECGGCDLQHFSLVAQRKAKCEMVRSTLQHLAAVQPQRGVELVGTELPGTRYRRRAVFHVDQQARIGFFRRKSADVVDAQECLIVDKRIDWARSVIREAFRQHLTAISSIVIECGESEIVAVLYARIKAAEGSLRLACQQIALPNGIKVLESGALLDRENLVGRFSQVNSAANLFLIDSVIEFVGDVGLSTMTELFAGSGNITTALCASSALYATRIDAVEVDKHLSAALALLSSSHPNLHVHNCSVEKFLRRNALGEIVVLDPPRAGARTLFENMSPRTTRRVVYVSCSVATLARDLKLASKAGYRLIETRVLDMFPQTHHVETISLLEVS